MSTPASAAPGLTEAEKEARDKALRTAYGTATKQLRDNHRDEFNKLYASEAKALGFEWEPRLTDEQRAEKDMLALLEAHPSLAEKIVAEADKIAAARGPEA